MKPKLLYMELLENNYGNKRLDNNIISYLAKFADTTVVCSHNWFEKKIIGVKYIEYEISIPSYISGARNQHYYKHLEIIKIAERLDKKESFDYLFFASYHSYVMAQALFGIQDIHRVFIMHHNNIDLIDNSKIGSYIFKLYCKKVKHIVLADFIKQHLVDKYGISSDNIFYLPHPLNIVVRGGEKEYDCVGISNSNDENWIKTIIQKEESEQLFKVKNKRVVLRSKNEEFDDGNLKVIKGFLEDDLYYDYINKAKCIFLPFPDSFKYRMSGSIVDAFSNYTTVVGSKIPLFQSFEKRYSYICQTVSEVDDFIDLLLDGNNNLELYKKLDFERFLLEHSDEAITEKLKGMFCG